MPSETYEQWRRLCEDARLAELPRPALNPSPFRDRWELSLDGSYKVTGDDAKDAMEKMSLFISGYSAALLKAFEPVEDRDSTTFEDRCDEVLLSGGMGGPADHIIIVQALLALREELKGKTRDAHQTL